MPHVWHVQQHCVGVLLMGWACHTFYTLLWRLTCRGGCRWQILPIQGPTRHVYIGGNRQRLLQGEVQAIAALAAATSCVLQRWGLASLPNMSLVAPESRACAVGPQDKKCFNAVKQNCFKEGHPYFEVTHNGLVRAQAWLCVLRLVPRLANEQALNLRRLRARCRMQWCGASSGSSGCWPMTTPETSTTRTLGLTSCTK